jgi:phage shock protein PspC (stress-responsive transcriptional regulator)
MRCTNCGNDTEFDAAYCRFCGTGFGVNAPRRLTRFPSEGKLAGVCAGLAYYLKVDVTIVRLLWVTLSIVPGAIIGGVIAYAAAWLLMPEATAPVEARPVARLYRSETNRKVAGVCGGIAAYLNVDATLVRVAFVALSIYPGALVCGVIAYVIGWVLIPLAPPAPLEPVPA